jgi:hypothetical protein
MSNLNRVIKITKIFPRPKPGEKKINHLKDILHRLLVSIHKLSTGYQQTRPTAPRAPRKNRRFYSATSLLFIQQVKLQTH